MNILAQPTTALTLDRESLARDIRALPSLPPVVLQLMDLLQQPDAGLDEFADTLRLDQALSVKVLQAANSPFYGLSGRILSVRDAIHVLGLRQLSTLVIAAALTLQFEALHGRSLHMRAFWRHSIACAVAARQLALQRGWNDAAAFTAGLLHDVGRLVVDSHYPEQAAEIIAWADQQDISHSEAEHALTGIDHTEPGALGVRALAVLHRYLPRDCGPPQAACRRPRHLGRCGACGRRSGPRPGHRGAGKRGRAAAEHHRLATPGACRTRPAAPAAHHRRRVPPS